MRTEEGPVTHHADLGWPITISLVLDVSSPREHASAPDIART